MRIWNFILSGLFYRMGDAMKPIPHKVTERQLQVLQELEKTTNLNEVQRALRWKGRELSNMINYLYQRGFINRIGKSTYRINEDFLYNSKPDQPYKAIEIPDLKIDINKIPKEVQEFIWSNRKMTCSELKRITKLPRFYIRQYIYERKLKEFPRCNQY